MIVHMGGVSRENTFDAIAHSNIVGFYNLYEGCRKNGVRRVVWGSSNHAIGFYPRTQVLDGTRRGAPGQQLRAVQGRSARTSRSTTGNKYRVRRFGAHRSCFPEPTGPAHAHDLAELSGIWCASSSARCSRRGSSTR